MTFLLPRRALAMIAPVLALRPSALPPPPPITAPRRPRSSSSAARAPSSTAAPAPAASARSPCPTAPSAARRSAPAPTRRDVDLHVAEAFPNGEGGVCAPIEARIVLGTGTPDRLVLAVDGDSCQDGAGDPTTTAFTGLGRFSVKHGTGEYKAPAAAASPPSSRARTTTSG